MTYLLTAVILSNALLIQIVNAQETNQCGPMDQTEAQIVLPQAAIPQSAPLKTPLMSQLAQIIEADVANQARRVGHQLNIESDRNNVDIQSKAEDYFSALNKELKSLKDKMVRRLTPEQLQCLDIKLSPKKNSIELSASAVQLLQRAGILEGQGFTIKQSKADK